MTDAQSGSVAPTPSSLVAFLDDATELATPEVRAAVDVIRSAIAAQRESAVFLTVIIRTQGRRLEPFRDALLCLSAQSVEDFEIVVARHDALPEDIVEIDGVIREQDPGFRDRIRVVDVSGGFRAAPINAALALARGRYVAVYDDDDVLFADWVERFRDGAERAPDRMVRALAGTQRVRPEMWPTDEDGFRTLSWPKAEYDRHFDPLTHLRVNHSPFMTWAFPRWLFTIFGLRFDEQLHVCEDWDLILRGSRLAGVVEVDALTSIYRRWEGGASSYSAHAVAEWRASEGRVIHRLDAAPVLLPEGSVEGIRQVYAELDEANRGLWTEHSSALGALRQLDAIHASRSWRLLRRLAFVSPAVRVAARATRPVRSLLRRVR